MAHIIVMEDDAAQSMLMAAALNEAGHEVTETANATEALTALRARQGELLVTDIFVNDPIRASANGGILLIGRVRTARLGLRPEPWADLPILAISGAMNEKGQPHLLQAAESVGADRALRKPLDLDEFVQVAEAMIRTWRADADR